MTVITRFAPSPTGSLHIGSARTALFNWLFARHQGGKFLLRIEDTDRARSTQDAIDVIFKSLQWLELTWDDDPVFQFARADRHAAIAHQLLTEGKAYYCYCTPEELEEMRETARAENRPPRYDGRWRDRDPREAPADVAPTIRFKAPQIGETIVHDLVQGSVRLDNSQLDDMVLLRGDGTPTYMLSVVVDDHDMNITHIIRGDDHLTNAFRQYHLYQACGWRIPEFAHIPLIHGADGAKLSKRHGALGTEAYREMGFLPEAMRNYLLRLGWAHGDEEIISTEQAISWFDLSAVGRSPSRFDIAKLTHLNGHYIRQASNEQLLDLILPLMQGSVNEESKTRLRQGMPGLKQRASTLNDLATAAQFYMTAPNFTHLTDNKALSQLTEPHALIVQAILSSLVHTSDLTEERAEMILRQTADHLNLKLGDLAQIVRVALTGKTISPSLFEVMRVLGGRETQARLSAFIEACYIFDRKRHR